MDLKFYHGKIIIISLIIPHVYHKLCISLLSIHWISIYGPADKFLSDNGGEFVNNEFLAL